LETIKLKNIGEVFWIFLSLGCTSFGGPIAHIAYFRQAFVEKKKWLSEQEFAHLLVICQTLPGPASSQLGFAIGLLRAGGIGAIAAFIAFTFPSVCLLILFANFSSVLDATITSALIQGLGIVAFVVVLQAVIGMSQQLLQSRFHWIIALCVFSAVLLNVSLLWQILSISVSYTHLRAHETVLDLVCRLLLEKKNKHRNTSTITNTRTQEHL